MVFDPALAYRKELCTGCGICSSVCPVSAVRTGTGGKVVSFGSSCIGCGHCGCYCPSDCFALEPLDESDKTSPEGLIDSVIRNRRSTRIFLSRPLSEDVLQSVLEPVGYAPTGHNDQGIQVLVLTGCENVRKKLVDPLVRIVRILDLFRLVTLLAGPSREHVRRLRRGEDLITWGAPCVLFFKAPLRNVTGSADCVIAATMVSMKAEAMGIGTLWNGVLKILSPFLGTGRASAVICLGYPRLKKYHRLPERTWKKKRLQGLHGSGS